MLDLVWPCWLAFGNACLLAERHDLIIVGVHGAWLPRHDVELVDGSLLTPSPLRAVWRLTERGRCLQYILDLPRLLRVVVRVVGDLS